MKVVVRKLVQYAKCGSCARRPPLPPEVAWFSVNREDKDSRVKPESLLSLDDVRAMRENEFVGEKSAYPPAAKKSK